MIIRRAKSLNGPEGLILSVIHQATNDALGDGQDRGDAVAYFAGEVYRKHVTALGLPGDSFPEAIEEAGREYSEILVN